MNMLYVTMRSDLPNYQERNQSDFNIQVTVTYFIYRGVMRVTAQPYICNLSMDIRIHEHIRGRWKTVARQIYSTVQEYSTR